jgi:Family of unknown function (DUF5681)
VTTPGRGLRTGQQTGQRNTTITPEMEAAQWQPGRSGNPGGRPKKKPITDALRQLLEQEYSGKEKRFKGLSNVCVLALRMFELAMSGDLRAFQEIADRVEGKVATRQEYCGPDGGAIPWLEMSREESERRLTILLTKEGLERLLSKSTNQSTPENRG